MRHFPSQTLRAEHGPAPGQSREFFRGPVGIRPADPPTALRGKRTLEAIDSTLWKVLPRMGWVQLCRSTAHKRGLPNPRVLSSVPCRVEMYDEESQVRMVDATSNGSCIHQVKQAPVLHRLTIFVLAETKIVHEL